MAAVVMAMEIVAIGVTILVILIAAMTWNLQIDWGHLLNRQRHCSRSNFRSFLGEDRA